MNKGQLASLKSIKMHSIIEVTIQTSDIDYAVDSIISALYSVSFPGCWTLDKVEDKDVSSDIILNDGSKKDGESDREKIKSILLKLSNSRSIYGTKLRFMYTDKSEESTCLDLDDKLRELEDEK